MNDHFEVVSDIIFFKDSYAEVFEKAPWLGLNNQEISLFLALLYYYDPHKLNPWPKQEKLGQHIGLSNRMISRLMSGLKKRGLITTKFTGRTNITNITPLLKRLKTVSKTVNKLRPAIPNIGSSPTKYGEANKQYMKMYNTNNKTSGKNLSNQSPTGLEPNGSEKETAEPSRSDTQPDTASLKVSSASNDRRLRLAHKLQDEGLALRQAREEAVRICLRDFGIRSKTINQHFKKHPITRLETAIDGASDFKIKNKAGFVIRALEKGWNIKTAPP